MVSENSRYWVAFVEPIVIIWEENFLIWVVASEAPLYWLIEVVVTLIWTGV